MQVHFACGLLPIQFTSELITTVHASPHISLQQLYHSQQVTQFDGSLVVGLDRQKGRHVGLVMVGGHGSIYRALMQAGNDPAILAYSDQLRAYWGVVNRMFHKNLTYLILTSDHFYGLGYQNCRAFNLLNGNPRMVKDWFNDGTRYTEKATPAIVAEHLATWWPNRNFMSKH